MTDDHHHRPMRVHPLGHAEIVDAVVGDQICEIVLKKAELIIIGFTRLKSDTENTICEGGIWGG